MARLPDNWRDIAAEALSQKIPNGRACPVCGENRILEKLVADLTVLHGNKKRSYPQAVLVCTNCGYTSYHNLVVLGVYDKENRNNGGG